MKKRLHTILFSVAGIIFLSFATESFAESRIQEGDTLTLAQCLSIARQQHPLLHAASHSIAVSEAKLGSTKSGYYPTIDFAASVSEIHPTPRNGASGSGYEEYAVGFKLNHNIYDFGRRTSRVKAAEYQVAATEAAREQTATTISLAVKNAYYSLLKAERNKTVAQETLTQTERHLARAKTFFLVGEKSKFDVTKAEVDVSNATLNLIKADNAIQIARVTLNTIMGIPEAPFYSVEDILGFEEYSITLTEAVQRAYQQRPDLLELIAEKEMAEEDLLVAEKGNLPTITGSAGYSFANRTLRLKSGWNAGIELSLPLFNGYATRYRIVEARENLQKIEALELVLRQEILSEVQQNVLSLTEAKERITTTQAAVKQAEENLSIVNGRYEVGVGNPIEVADAQVLFTTAQTSHIQALYDYKLARAFLEKTMGEQ
ncbi:MAG: TolC family protein [Candidatus Ratteibacteria bacterium]|jgi:outer membrane protein